jgi:hypothetical protein
LIPLNGVSPETCGRGYQLANPALPIGSCGFCGNDQREVGSVAGVKSPNRNTCDLYSIVAINIKQFIVAIAQVANSDAPAATIDSQSAKALVFFEVQSRMARIRYKLSERNIDPILNV